MPQRLCSKCAKELTPTERALGEIQCTDCYRRWIKEAVVSAEPMIRRIIDELEQEKQNPGTAKG